MEWIRSTLAKHKGLARIILFNYHTRISSVSKVVSNEPGNYDNAATFLGNHIATFYITALSKGSGKKENGFYRDTWTRNLAHLFLLFVFLKLQSSEMKRDWWYLPRMMVLSHELVHAYLLAHKYLAHNRYSKFLVPLLLPFPTHTQVLTSCCGNHTATGQNRNHSYLI